ncbi:small heat shock protein [Aeropyrum pernix K1]|uniref:Small heat shock protein n=1 Tax=Aeropyrum pernix (strain ATCC 700893 / DSM 11879 / JCM 9820 / NBRC 100138 / K1) TaxID=272557 RepID=Q9YFZ9_AERPE|nr:Hsp20/alpha crystallin family protein [Aeropyrum pernix]BAA79012.2 small heat shock protein [Aeropyrum pernix K1]
MSEYGFDDEFRRIIMRFYQALREAEETFSTMTRLAIGELREFEELLEQRLQEFQGEGIEPIVSVDDLGDRLRILIDLPGMDRESLNIVVLEDRVEISARIREHVVKRALGSLSEKFSFREYRGVYRLPAPVDPRSVRIRTRGSLIIVEADKKAAV